MQESMDYLIEILDASGTVKASAQGEEQAVLVFKGAYTAQDRIHIQVPEAHTHYIIRIDDAMDEAFVYLTNREIWYEIPFDEKKKSYNPQSFSGERHYLTCRKAEEFEVNAYHNLAKNVMDQHGDHGCYPHAYANVETRGESVFAARNAIDGVVANLSHGSWPYQSWGINCQLDAWLCVDFGRPVDFDKIVLWTRADFPHDNWWVQARLCFSDGSSELIYMEKSEKPHVFPIKKHSITSVKLQDLIQADDPSPFPALTQIEVYGTEKRK